MVGILIGLLAVMATTIVRVSTSQKQFYQGILANESQWLENWFTAHRTAIGQLGNEVKDVLYVIYRHSTTPAASEDELLKKIGNTLLPLPRKWRKIALDAPDDCHLEQGEIDQFETHLDGIGATLSQIKASKDRMQVGAHLGDVLWTLGFVLLLALTLILCCSIPNPPKFISEGASQFALMLIEIAFISVFFIILTVTQYLRAEAKEITRTVGV